MHTEGDDKQIRLSNIVLREVEHLNRLVEEFLIFARPTPPVQTMVDVPGLCREVAEAVCVANPRQRRGLD